MFEGKLKKTRKKKKKLNWDKGINYQKNSIINKSKGVETNKEGNLPLPSLNH